MDYLTINGERRDFADGVPATLSALLADLRVDSATVVAELDGTIVPREQFDHTPLSCGQRLELVRFVGGG